MEKLAAILATSAVLLTGCQRAPEGYRKITMRQDGALDYVFLKYVAGEKYTKIDSP